MLGRMVPYAQHKKGNKVKSRIKAGLSIEEALYRTGVRLDGRSSAWKNAHRG